MTEKITFCLLVVLYLLLALFGAIFLDLLDYCLKNAYAAPVISKPALQRYYPDKRNAMTAPYLRALCGFHGSTQLLSADVGNRFRLMPQTIDTSAEVSVAAS